MQTLQVFKFVGWCPIGANSSNRERRNIPEYTFQGSDNDTGVFSDFRGVFFFSVVTALGWLVLTKHLLVYYSLLPFMLLVSANFCNLLLVLSLLSLLLAPPNFLFLIALPTSLFYGKNGSPTKDIGQLAKLKRRSNLVGWQSYLFDFVIETKNP